MTLRVLLAVTHLLGVGHLTRTAAVARGFARAGHRATLVSGGVAAPLVSTKGVSLVQLPPVRIAGTAFTRLLDHDGRPVGEDHLQARADILVATLQAVRPHVVITELFPFGRRVLAAEFLALLEAAQGQTPPPLVLSSVRDILAAPKASRVEETHRRLRTHYDAVLVHGDPGLVPLDRSWPEADAIADLVRYTGYVDDSGDGGAAGGLGGGNGGGILVSGGGSAAGMRLFHAALGAAAMGPTRRWRILVGRAVEDHAFADLKSRALTEVVVERARADFRALLRGSALSVSQAGYNTAIDLLRTGTRSVLVPFEAGGETEQRLRADDLSMRGIAEVLPESELSAETLAARVERALAAPRAKTPVIDLEGARRTVEIVEELARPGGPSISSRRLPGSAWRPLEDALARATDRGRDLALWWRDDDATADTPALERLLALARRFLMPIAIAAIPALAHRSLRDRLEGETSAVVLIHGLAHTNHAPPCEKRAELGPHRPLASLHEDATSALAKARERLGPQLLPVLVPPWNRIAPELVAALPALGYGGVSTFGRATLGEGSQLRQVNPQIDPIDWHGARSLLDPQALIGRIVRQLGEDAENVSGPVGLLTHHLVQDEALWGFCEALLERFAACAQVRRPFVSDLFSARVLQNRDHDGP